MTLTPSSNDKASETTAAATITHRMSDDGPGPDTVRGKCRRERDLHREQCRLDTVNAGDGLRGRDSVGDREARLGVDQRLKTSNGLGEYRFLTE